MADNRRLGVNWQWDIPILFMARFGDPQEDLTVLEQLLDSPPVKFLELGTDQLLMGHFRGDSRGRGSAPNVFVEVTHSKQEYGRTEPK